MIPRRIAVLGVAALLLGGAGIAVAATYDRATVSAAGGASSPDPPALTSTTVEATTTTAPPDTSTTTTAKAAAPSTTARRATTTTARATTTLRPASTTTTTAAAAACIAAQIEMVASTDKSTYGPGEQVRVASTLRNRSSTTCSWASYNFSATFRDPAGATIIGYVQHADGFGAVPFQPNQAHQASTAWERLTCPEPFCKSTPPGVYSVEVTWSFPGGPYTVTRPFTLT